jgi:predicted HicB family RNase H-like nuclease
MGTEKKSGVKVESSVAVSLHRKLRAKARKSNSSIAQIIRDLLQKYVK